MIFAIFGVFLCACIPAAATGGLFPPGDWYRELNKPRWTPPDWLFPVAWSTLYLLMAGAGARVAVSPDNGLAMALWSFQIGLNALWSPVFFGLHKIKLGMIVLSALWVAVAATMLALGQVDFWAGVMFAPYLLWVTIAGALNLSVWRLNPDLA